jgi:short-subunit dehydrogenase
VTSFSEAIRGEVRKAGVTVTALCPGPVRTEFSDVAQRGSGKREQSSPGFMHVAVEDVVRAGLRAVAQGTPIVVPGVVMKIAMLLVRLTPMAILRRV